jgi:hypothetical protein
MLVRKNQGEQDASIQNSKSCKSSTWSCNILNEESSKPILDFVRKKWVPNFPKALNCPLNQHMKMDPYPMPLMEDMHRQLSR